MMEKRWKYKKEKRECTMKNFLNQAFIFHLHNWIRLAFDFNITCIKTPVTDRPFDPSLLLLHKCVSCKHTLNEINSRNYNGKSGDKIILLQ